MSYGVVTAYRLVIEGLGIEAVTDPAMERLSPDAYRRRVVGLLRDGLRISEQCDPAFAEIEATGMTVTIVDRQEDQIWCQHLSRQPSRRTWLTADIDDTSTTLTVASTEGFTVDEVLHVGTECMIIDAVPTATTLTVQRGSLDTIPQYHYTADGDRLLLPVVTLTYPIGLEGRRAYLYRYVDGDSLQGDGTLIGRYFVSTDAKLEDDGASWTITLDSIVSLLKQPIASDIEDPITIRGIYYPPGYGIWRLHEMVSYLLVDTNRRAEWRMSGHFETQEDFCAALQEVIRTAMDPLTADLTVVDISAWESTGLGVALIHSAFGSASYVDTDGVFVLPTDSGWQLVWTTDALNPSHLTLGMIGDASVIDGGLPGGVFGDILEPDYIPVPGLAPEALTTYSSTTLRGGAPRAVWGNDSRRRGADPDAELSVWDLFLSTTSTAFSGVDIEWKDGGDPAGYSFGVDSTLSGGRVRVLPDGGVTGVRYSYPSRDVEIRAQRLIATGTLADFRDGLVALSPELANRGATPFVTTSDLASWTTVVNEAAAGRPPLSIRNYKTAGEVELGELISHDCRLLSVFPALDSDGKITLRHLRLPTGTSVGDFEIDESTTLVSEQPPTWERNAVYGSINTVKIRTFYDVIAEEHTGATYVINDVTAQSIRKAPKELEIAPLSYEFVRDARVWDYDLAVGVARRVLSIFGRPYSVVRVAVPHTLLTTALCGTVAVLTSPRIPDPSTGERGVTRKGGLVIGREWDLATETGILTMMVADSPIAGYAPSAFVSASSVVSGNQYDLTVTFDDPSGDSMAPAGASLSDFYAVGDKLSLLVWDSTTQSPQTCTVDAIDDGAGELRVTFSSAPTLTGTRYLRFFQYDDAGLTESQRRFAFYADADRLLDSSAGLDSAREYSA